MSFPAPDPKAITAAGPLFSAAAPEHCRVDGVAAKALLSHNVWSVSYGVDLCFSPQPCFNNPQAIQQARGIFQRATPAGLRLTDVEVLAISPGGVTVFKWQCCYKLP
uniref:Uncharacterized protein n=1 Tax=Hubei virga-like viurs 8 TaxID=1923341 RepID=A0A1L3KKB6_9VIRU|nr:hypothetical protein [Hubei virga-like viurs 8]